jgi:segregation and condensation protein A
MSYEVTLDVFQGPLDLLLHLVSRERVDVAEVSISSITEEYLRAVRKMEEVDLELASSFLVLAATLLELKSLKLLPKRDDDPELAGLLEERDHLLHRLVEFSTFKGAAAAIADALVRNEGFFSRVADVPEELIPAAGDLMEGVTAQQILELARGALAPKAVEKVDMTYVAPIRVSVREMVDELAEQIKEAGATSFRELCARISNRIEIVVRFLALLELFKAESIEMEQVRPFAEISIRWRNPNKGPARRYEDERL